MAATETLSPDEKRIFDRLTSELVPFIQLTTLTFMVADFREARTDRMASVDLAARYDKTPRELAEMFRQWGLGIHPRTTRFAHSDPRKGYSLPDIWGGIDRLVSRLTGSRVARRDLFDTGPVFDAMRHDPLWRVWLLLSPSFRDKDERLPTTTPEYREWRRKHGADRETINAEIDVVQAIEAEKARA